MKKQLFTLISFLFIVSYCYAGFISYGDVLYWECSYCPDTYTGVIQHLRGDGETSIRVLPSIEEPEKVVESNRVLRLNYYDSEDGKDKYSTQYSGVEVWVERNKYVYIVSTIGVYYIAKFNPEEGVISGTQSDINRYDFNNNSSSESSRNRSSSGGSSRKQSCSNCGGTGVEPTPSPGGSHFTWVAHYNARGTQCRYCGKYTEHFHNKCSSCNVPRY